jgi:O-antigen/teichoic acid export membrane protein
MADEIIKNTKWIRSGVYSIGSRMSVLIFGFGSFYFLIRYLPQHDFGAWSLFLTITTIVEMSRNGLLQNALIKLLHSHTLADSNKVISASWIINLFYSLVIYLTMVLFAERFGAAFGVAALRPMFLYYGLTMALLVPLSQFNYLQQAKSSFSGIFWTAFGRQGSLFLAVLFIYFLRIDVSLVGLVVVHAACTFIGLIIAFLSARRLVESRFEWDWTITKRVFHFGKYVMGTNLCSIFFKSVDQFSVGYFLNASSVALYSSAMRLSNLIEYPATSIAEVVYPHSTYRISQEGEVVTKSLYEKSVGLTLTVTVPVVLITFLLADHIIYLIAGSAYAASADILRVTILFGLITPFNRQFGMAMDSSGRPHMNFALLLFALIINIISNAVFIHAMGVIGAAYGTLLSYVIISVAGHFVLKKIFDVSMKNVIYYMALYYKNAFHFLLDWRNTLKFKI